VTTSKRSSNWNRRKTDLVSASTIETTTTKEEDPKQTKARKKPNREESVLVQRRLARKMAEAQAGWIVLSEKEKKKGKTVTTTRDTRKEEKEEDFDDEDESALFNLSLVNATVFEEAYSRGKWLLFLLVLQSCSSFVLSSNEALIQDNVIITLYLTMLVGAGGNAGNQSAIEVITGLATGAIEYNAESFGKTVSKQLRVGALLGFFLGAGSFARVYVTNRDVIGSFAISTACFSIVVCSTIVGGALPYVLIFCGQEPANAGSSVQVCMDVLGVTITCLVCTYIFQNADFVVGVLHSTTAS
tara:strand:- start:895 stop:1794 length:900 start_codon:yes stop_codon:yes gene_type:complete